MKTYGHTLDPRRDESDRWIKFNDLWPRQEEFCRWLQELFEKREGGLVEKSRDSGLSWMAVGFMAWRVTFYSDENIGIGAAFENQVDHPSSEKAMMWRLREFVVRLPSWMYKKKFVSTFCNFFNPNTGSRVEGQAGNQIGRGGRTTCYFVDEFAFVADADKVFSAVYPNTGRLYVISTVNGMGNKFQQMRDSGSWNVFVFDWTEDPRKLIDPNWEQKAREEMGDVLFEQEYGRNYASSLDNITVPGDHVRACIGYKRSVEDIEDACLGPGLAGLDLGQGTAANGTLGLRQGYVYLKTERILAPTIEDVFNKAKQMCLQTRGPEDESVDALCYDASGPTGKAASEEVNKHRHKQQDGSTEIDGINIMPVVGQTQKFVAPPLADGRRATDVFVNYRSYAWWEIRERARKTWENVYGEGTAERWPDSECLSLPVDDPVLYRELSTPLFFYNGGKIQIESKVDMKKRGVKSPDRADALVLAFLAKPPPPRFASRFSKR